MTNTLQDVKFFLCTTSEKSDMVAPSQPAVERNAEDPERGDPGDFLSPELEVNIKSDFPPGKNNS